MRGVGWVRVRVWGLVRGGLGWVRVRVWGLVRGEQVPIKGCIYPTIYLSGWIPTSDTDCSNLSTQAMGGVGAVSDTGSV